MRACFGADSGTSGLRCKGTESVSLVKALRRVHKKIHRSFKNDVIVRSCAADPEQIRPGDVYFAVPGMDSNSGESLEEAVGLAIHHGCVAVVADRPIADAENIPYFIMPNVAEGFAAFCQAIHDYPARSLKMIGITGTSGKTSTSYLISGMLAEAGFQVGLIGSLGVFDGSRFQPLCAGEEWMPGRIAELLARMAMNGCTHVVFEVSSRLIAQGRLGGIKFDAVCLTNIRRDHLDFHQSVEQYRRSKLGIFKYAKKKALAVCNVDDRITEAIVPLIDQPLLSVGIRNQAEVGSVLVERFPSEQTFIVTAGTEATPVCTKIIGDEHMYNCMMAAALGIGLEIDVRTIARGIERVENIPGRMERIECGQPFHVFLDAARTADSLAASLKTAKEVTGGRLICVFGAAEYHDPGKRAFFGKALETLADTVILTTATDRLEPGAASAICDIGQGFSSQEGVYIMPDRAESLAWALSEAEEGDTVMIFGRGESEIADVRGPDEIPFCDRHFVRQWLYENQACAA